jgi:hypothetical protein
MPIFDFNLESGRSMSGGGFGGNFSCFCFPFLFVSGDCFPSGGAFTSCHFLPHSCNGLAASTTSFLGRYSSWLVVKNSSHSIFWLESNWALRVPVATS